MLCFRKMLTGLESMTSGTVQIMGLKYPDRWEEIQKLIGLCPQHGILYPELTVREHLEFYGRLKGTAGENLQQSLRE